MKRLIIYVLLMCYLSFECYGQDNRILFIRNSPFFPIAGFFEKYRLYVNGEKKYTFSAHSFYLDKIGSSVQECSLKLSWSEWPFNKKKISVTANADSITIITIRRDPWSFAAKVVFKKRSLEYLREMYDHKKWFRKKLTKRGYNSIDKLIY